MLHADWALNAGQSDVEAVGGEPPLAPSFCPRFLNDARNLCDALCVDEALFCDASGLWISDSYFGFLYFFLDDPFQPIHPLADLALCLSRSGLEPQLIDLRQDPVLARHPAIAKVFPVRFVLDSRGFLVKRVVKIGKATVDEGRRVIFEFGNGVHVSD